MGHLRGILLCYGVRPNLHHEVSFVSTYYECYRLLVIFPDLTNTRFFSSSCSSLLILRDTKVLQVRVWLELAVGNVAIVYSTTPSLQHLEQTILGSQSKVLPSHWMLLLSQITALLSRKVIAHRDALPATTTTATTRSEIERALLDAARLWKLQLAAAETDRASDILDCLVGPDGTAPVLLEEEASCGAH